MTKKLLALEILEHKLIMMMITYISIFFLHCSFCIDVNITPLHSLKTADLPKFMNSESIVPPMAKKLRFEN